MLEARSGRYFGPAFIQAMHDKYAHLAPTRRPLSYDLAVDEDYEQWRVWLDDQLACLPKPVAITLANKLWPDQHFWPTIIELATGAGLRATGLDVAYEQTWENSALTPDWTVLDSAGLPLCFVEVHTDEPRRETYAAMRSWNELSQRIATIPVPVVLVLDRTHMACHPPLPALAKKISRSLRAQLLQPRRGGRFEACGYRFVILAGQKPPNGLRACFEPPSGTAGPVTAENLAKKVEAKVSRYKELADKFAVPLVVAVGAHKFTGVGLDNLDDLLEGRPNLNFQFGLGDTVIGERTVNMGEVPHWEMPQQLSGLLWVSNDFPFSLTCRPNPNADHPMPKLLT